MYNLFVFVFISLWLENLQYSGLVYFVLKNVDRLTTEKYKLNWFEPQKYIHTTVNCNFNAIFFSERKRFDAYEIKTLIGCEVLKVDVSLIPYFDL